VGSLQGGVAAAVALTAAQALAAALTVLVAETAPTDGAVDILEPK
jgi:hypothetical protein